MDEFLGSDACTLRRLGVTLDAVGALRHMSDRHGDQLLGFARERAVSEPRLAEYLKCCLGVGTEAAPLFGELASGPRIDCVTHKVAKAISAPLNIFSPPMRGRVQMKPSNCKTWR